MHLYRRGFVIVLKYECETMRQPQAGKPMNIRTPHPIQLLALGAAVVRGLAEFVSLQRWRLRERGPR